MSFSMADAGEGQGTALDKAATLPVAKRARKLRPVDTEEETVLVYYQYATSKGSSSSTTTKTTTTTTTTTTEPTPVAAS